MSGDGATVINFDGSPAEGKAYEVTWDAAAAEKGVPGNERGRKRIVTAAVKQVSEHLGNTPTVARSSYVDPRVIERFDDGRTVLPVLQKLEGCEAGLPRDDGSRAVLERAVVDLIAG